MLLLVQNTHSRQLCKERKLMVAEDYGEREARNGGGEQEGSEERGDKNWVEE
jgi:hypothetical protein